MQLYNVLWDKVTGILVILSIDDGLSDLAFSQGWRIKKAEVAFKDALILMKHFKIPFLTESEFYLEYLENGFNPDEEAIHFAGMLTSYFEEPMEAIGEEEIEEDLVQSMYQEFVEGEINDKPQWSYPVNKHMTLPDAGRISI